jgi:hypothetical protein
MLEYANPRTQGANQSKPRKAHGLLTRVHCGWLGKPRVHRLVIALLGIRLVVAAATLASPGSLAFMRLPSFLNRCFGNEFT